MRIHVLGELRQPLGATASLELEQADLLMEDLEVRGLSGLVSLLRTDRGLLVSLRASASVREQCSRCLQPELSPIEVCFEEEYVPFVDPNTGAAVRFAGSTDAFRISEDFFLDLREGLRQYVLMSEPSKPLCSPDCAGLCPACGADLNQHPCACGQANDARWQPLAALTRISEGR